MMARLSWGMAACVVATLAGPRIAEACAPAPPERERVAVAEESAIIIWDEAAKTEHFVRRASFRSEARDFGFLVPSPAQPVLDEADERAFEALEDMIRPEIEYSGQPALEPTISCLFFLSARSAPSAAGPPPMVRILEAKRVGDYDATVLEADDAGALAEWLTKHGYAKRDALTEWLAPYVEKKWKLTAFKIADDVDGGPKDRALATRAVRMSFKTDRPFFPYREPRDQREKLPPFLVGPRTLRIFFFGVGRFGAQIGDGKTPFEGRTMWSNPVKAAALDLYLPIVLPEGAWMTAIEDNASPRPGVDELWLDRAKDQVPLKPRPTIVRGPTTIPVPLDLLAIVGTIVALIVRRVRKKKPAPP